MDAPAFEVKVVGEAAEVPELAVRGQADGGPHGVAGVEADAVPPDGVERHGQPEIPPDAEVPAPVAETLHPDEEDVPVRLAAGRGEKPARDLHVVPGSVVVEGVGFIGPVGQGIKGRSGRGRGQEDDGEHGPAFPQGEEDPGRREKGASKREGGGRGGGEERPGRDAAGQRGGREEKGIRRRA